MRSNHIVKTVKRNYFRTLIFLSGVSAAGWLGASTVAPSAAIAHGSNITVTQQAVEIQATFEDGSPMATAQVRVYAPNRPETPLLNGTTDKQGKFWFTPNAEGNWEVTVRQAGHGQTTTFVVEAATASSTAEAEKPLSSSNRSSRDLFQQASSPTGAAQSDTMQQWLSVAAVVWGFIGTALFFKSRAFKHQQSFNNTPH